jgi:hypothetical protein
MNKLWLGVSIAIVGLWWVEGRLGRIAARPRAGGRNALTFAALLVVLGVLIVAPQLGLRYGASLVPRTAAAILFLLLLTHLWLLLPRLRPLLGRRLPARPDLVFFVLPAVVYLALMPWATAQRPPNGDEPYNLLLAHSLAYDFDAELTNNYANEDSRRFGRAALKPQVGDPRGQHGEMYSRHNVLLPALLAPAYRLAGRHGALAVMCLFAAALAWMTLRLARHHFADRPGPALLAYYILAFTSPLLVYSHQVWVEIPAALLLAMALDAALTMTEGSARRLRAWLPLLAPLALLPLLKIRFLLVAVPVILMLAWRQGRRVRRLVLFTLAGSALLGAAILAFNEWQYGNPLKYHNLQRMSFYWNQLERYPRGLAGLFFDSAFGLFATAPVWALMFAPGRGKLGTIKQLLWIMTPYLFLLVPRSEWYGGWSPPFRYGCVALPLLALLLVPPLERRRGAAARILLGCLGSATAILTALWVARPGWTYNISHGRSHVVDFLSLNQGVDVSRFFPSATRPNLALWLWPPALVLVVALAWRWRRLAPPAMLWLGAALPLVGLAALAGMSHEIPTRIVEVEDPYIEHQGGKVWPFNWAVGRPRFRGGWRLEPGDRMAIPVVPGGRYLSVELELRRFGVLRPAVRVHAEGAAVRWGRAPKTLEWTRLNLSELEWPEKADRLEISLRLPAGEDPEAAVLVDRVLLSWSADAPLSEAKAAAPQ